MPAAMRHVKSVLPGDASSERTETWNLAARHSASAGPIPALVTLSYVTAGRSLESLNNCETVQPTQSYSDAARLLTACKKHLTASLLY